VQRRHRVGVCLLGMRSAAPPTYGAIRPRVIHLPHCKRRYAGLCLQGHTQSTAQPRKDDTNEAQMRLPLAVVTEHRLVSLTLLWQPTACCLFIGNPPCAARQTAETWHQPQPAAVAAAADAHVMGCHHLLPGRRFPQRCGRCGSRVAVAERQPAAVPRPLPRRRPAPAAGRPSALAAVGQQRCCRNSCLTSGRFCNMHSSCSPMSAAHSR
jgi:hypothetical protein